jgi:hypothetical protein
MANENKEDVAGVAVAAGGALAGAAGAVLGVSSSGAVAGLGAPGITSGLAAVGGLVGEGMMVGLVGVVAAPVAAGAIAYGGYKLYKWWAKKK